MMLYGVFVSAVLDVCVVCFWLVLLLRACVLCMMNRVMLYGLLVIVFVCVDCLFVESMLGRCVCELLCGDV